MVGSSVWRFGIRSSSWVKTLEESSLNMLTTSECEDADEPSNLCNLSIIGHVLILELTYFQKALDLLPIFLTKLFSYSFLILQVNCLFWLFTVLKFNSQREIQKHEIFPTVYFPSFQQKGIWINIQILWFWFEDRNTSMNSILVNWSETLPGISL